MTIELSVSEVREALASAASVGEIGVGEPATRLLGKLFHQVFADLVGSDPLRSGLRIIAESPPQEERRVAELLNHTWLKLVAPRLVRNQAALQTSTAQVLVFWQAVKSLTSWLGAVVEELLEQDPSARGAWERLSEMLRAEVPLACELREPSWSEPVRLVGIADLLLRVPNKPCWCAIELKLGRSKPSVDLGQAALYHLILCRAGAPQKPDGSALALMRFAPDREEHVVKEDGLGDAQRGLLDLVGRMAGVIKEDPKPPDPSPYEELGKRLVRAYREHGVGIELRGAPLVGPRFLRFETRLTPGMRLDNLRRRTTEVQMRLQLPAEPIVVQQTGRLYIDVARPDPETVLFSSIVPKLPSIDKLRGSAKVPIGVDPAGNVHFADLGSAGRSHVLAAGTTGSGKSEWLRMVIAGLICSNTPETLRFVTLDPKLAAFADLESSPFLWKKSAWWVPGGDRQASEVFQDLVEEMDDRYQLTHGAGVDNFNDYVEKTRKPLARIVCVCDEYFALVSQSREEKTQIENAVSLLGAKARAAGIHLILATQQPSRQIIRGAIDANLPCRVALALTRSIESNMILGCQGAERLTGCGDLLYKDFGDPVRLQAPYLPGEERRRWLRA